MSPVARLWLAGVTAMDRRRADVTVSDALPDVDPEVTVRFALPAATAVATIASMSVTLTVQTNELTGAIAAGPGPCRGNRPPLMPGVPSSPVVTSQ